MNSQNSRKIIVASGMAVVVGILAVIFTLRSHHDALVAQASQQATPFTEVPAAPAAVAQTPDAPAAVAQVPEAPAAVSNNESAGTKGAATASAVEPKLARSEHPAKADTSAVAGTVTHTRSTADSSEKPAAQTAGNSAERVKSTDGWTPPPATSSPPADGQKMGTSTELAASDTQITTDVKSQLAGDSLSKDASIGVITTDGVVALTGTLASQNAIAHVKDVAGKVKDVKSVDTSALVLASL
jgi:hyperosmotically inducible protein